MSARRYTETGFIVAMARHIRDTTQCDDMQCLRLAGDAYREHMHAEKLEFGDPAYAWDFDGAKTLADALVLDHLEPRP